MARPPKRKQGTVQWQSTHEVPIPEDAKEIAFPLPPHLRAKTCKATLVWSEE